MTIANSAKRLIFYFLYYQACKGEDLGKVEFEEEIKKRFKMVYVPNWFSVDLKTGVNDKSCNRDVWKVYLCRHLNKDLIADAFVCLLNRCSPSRWTRVIASLPGCLQRTLGFQAPMGPTQSVRMPGLTFFTSNADIKVESYTDLLSLLYFLQWI